MSQKTVLLLTHSKDYYTIDRVERAIGRKGCRPFRFDTDKFPEQVKLSIHLDQGEVVLSLQEEHQQQKFYAKDVYSVWLRKIGTPYIPENMDPLLRKGCIKESGEVLEIFLKVFDSVRWIDRLDIVREAEDKLYQLRTAHWVGIVTPRTLITNDPQAVQDFYHSLEGNIAAKMLTPLTISMEGNTPFVHTSRIEPEDLRHLESLRHSPMVFQEYIPKEYELRIIYVDGQLFTGALHWKNPGETPVDWRTADQEIFKWEHFNAADDFANKIRAFMKQMGLYFGALDVILTPGGQYVFLEVNPTGEWGMLERDLGLNISDAIANALTK
ncbi:MAG: MvdC family ATP-grasp ribosomal peptide maturase [Candidatus Aminicenantes bacterium]|nr:MAG: MvdC family ATP-grasp ribosomal peptide maturase [Candidatus Aminicenantes bacterium]